ncbi:MAG TPA: hypothetical protein VHY83_10235 [Solirubrobacteraceae bacterium]|jgi:hypothetical protein|nr:hypothetical protein [Solirubrobacteraceae bacterium]
MSAASRSDHARAMVRYERTFDGESIAIILVCDCCGLVMPFSNASLEREIRKARRAGAARRVRARDRAPRLIGGLPRGITADMSGGGP